MDTRHRERTVEKASSSLAAPTVKKITIINVRVLLDSGRPVGGIGGSWVPKDE